jgi:hypothetical protein
VRFLREEGVGAAKCLKCSDDFLMLDSEDYWFDVIQKGYPRISRCSCKSTSFDLRFDYQIRDDGDVECIQVGTICSGCKKFNRRMTVDIDYGGTARLLSHPLVYCKRPKILYELRDLNLYVTKADVARIAEYLGRSLGCTFVSWIRRENKWVKEPAEVERVKDVILNGRYFAVFASLHALTLPEEWTLREEDSYWKHSEVIRISSPTEVGSGTESGLLFYVKYSNEFIDGDHVRKKSSHFLELTDQFITWLSREFISWRGRHCFDNKDEHLRIFGDRFR